MFTVNSNRSMNIISFIFIGCLLPSAGATYYCRVADPCGEANFTSFFEPYARFENCQHDNKNSFCDRYITPQWYRVNDAMLTQCPSLLSCGSLYPVWLNGTLPTSTDGIVDRKACKVGFESCCTRTYDIQIKHCGSFYAYCLAALDTCPERYCFGKHGSCEIPTTSVSVTTTTTTVHQTTPLPSTVCSNDPCIESNVRSVDDQESRSLHCEYKQADDDCDDDMTSGWYRSESPMVTRCPGLLSCGSIYPVWLNGTIPSTSEGVVTRQACQRGFKSCCSGSYNIKVRNCGRYTAYCLRPLLTCPSRYCFGTGQCQKDEEKDPDANDKEHSHGYLKVLLGCILGVLMLILIVMILINVKRYTNGRGKTGSMVNIQLTEKSPMDKERNGNPPPYSP